MCAFVLFLFFLYSRRKRKHDNQYSDWPYVKKPLNAFMIYMKEQRAKVVAETNIRWSATINKILGQRVNLQNFMTLLVNVSSLCMFGHHMFRDQI